MNFIFSLLVCCWLDHGLLTCTVCLGFVFHSFIRIVFYTFIIRHSVFSCHESRDSVLFRKFVIHNTNANIWIRQCSNHY